MDELNKRIIELMVRMDCTKSAFAGMLDVSLPLITHITSGRNKPGLDLIQKILTHIDQVSPDWLLLGKGPMYREQPKKQDFTAIIDRINRAESALTQPGEANKTMLNYHKLLMDEVLHLKELSGMITGSSEQLDQVRLELETIRKQLADQQ